MGTLSGFLRRRSPLTPSIIHEPMHPAAGLEAWCGDPLWLLETQVPLTPSIIHERMQLHNDSEKLPAPLELGCQAIN